MRLTTDDDSDPWIKIAMAEVRHMKRRGDDNPAEGSSESEGKLEMAAMRRVLAT